jgi:hypothetical protein
MARRSDPNELVRDDKAHKLGFEWAWRHGFEGQTGWRTRATDRLRSDAFLLVM